MFLAESDSPSRDQPLIFETSAVGYGSKHVQTHDKISPVDAQRLKGASEASPEVFPRGASSS